jgi:hypothetical protein
MRKCLWVAPPSPRPTAPTRATLAALKTVTAGDLLYVGEGYRSRIRERTFAGVDVNGSPFAPYSTRGPFYRFPNKDAANGRTAAGDAARTTASKNRFAKTGRIGIRTATGIRCESYSAAKAAHGAATALSREGLGRFQPAVAQSRCHSTTVRRIDSGPETDLLFQGESVREKHQNRRWPSALLAAGGIEAVQSD